MIIMANLSSLNNDTIVAQATASGHGGVGIIRVSGPDVENIAKAVLKEKQLHPRYAYYGAFYDEKGEVLDEGIALYFPSPNSFTGEAVLELQGHGGPVIMDLLLKRIIALGVRQANPGEFSERAFLNGKIDLAQAEAIADLISSSSEQAARSALRSLQGIFSTRIDVLIEKLIQLRVYIEAAIDFPEEEIDYLETNKINGDLSIIIDKIGEVVSEAQQGALLREGMNIVIAGRPNAGKSSLLNALSGRETAIVTDIEGTTRDVLREHIHIDGMPLHIIDTAGLRDTNDHVEKVGVKRAIQEIKNADRILLMVDASTTQETDIDKICSEFSNYLPHNIKVTVIRNKIDITGELPGPALNQATSIFNLSAKSTDGIIPLKEHLKECMGFCGATEGSFSARRRHLDALSSAQDILIKGKRQFNTLGAGELLAEDLRHAQQVLGEITGQFTSDDLLGRIFSSFCIGK